MIYMDHHATTPVDKRVLDAMVPYFTEIFGNAASTDHAYGDTAKKAVDTARASVAAVIGARPEEIVFTSGATESNNLAILGAAERLADRGRHLITCVTEHKAVLDTCKALESRGWRVTWLPVDQFGKVDPDDIRRAITNETVLVSIMAANNEIGTLAPIAEIGKITREAGVLLHTDAAQAVGHIPVNVNAWQVDLLSLSGHKLYGPKGVGALYVRSRSPRARVAPQQHGGGHERGMRSGTLNVPGIVGLGAAAKITAEGMRAEAPRVQHLRNRLWDGLRQAIEGIEMNGHPTDRLPHNLSVVIPGVESRAVLFDLKDALAISSGSACSTAVVEPSHVILALGYGEARAHQSLRFGLGRSTTQANVDQAIGLVCGAVTRSRMLMRPLVV
jgi:cysteine desulfurase